ncbi:hypothetical protein BGW39_002825 [Mortierella sp. 14UC]|nr:hypothetical protein BGW39_002825 [Mortierella sp. 14UC]
MTVSINIENEFGPLLPPYHQQQQQHVPPQWRKRTFTRRLAKRCLLVLISLTALFLATELYHQNRSKLPKVWRSPFILSDSSSSEHNPVEVAKAGPIHAKDFLKSLNCTRLQEIAMEPEPVFFDEPETLPPNGQRRPGARVIDIIPVNDELDMLEGSFQKVCPQVYRAVHLGAVMGVEDRILQEKLHDISWAPEVHERSLGMRIVLKESRARTGDWTMYSELDEIPRKDVIAALHGVDSEEPEDRSYRSGAEQILKVLPRGKDVYRLNYAFYEFSYEYLFEKKKWNGPVVFRYFKQNEKVNNNFISLSKPSTPQQEEQQVDPATAPLTSGSAPVAETLSAKKRPTAAEVFENFKDKDMAYYENWDTMKNHWIDGGFKTRWLRDSNDFPLLDQACWLCTYCQANISQILYKLRSSSHREYNRKEISNKAWILDRPNHELLYIPNNMNVPEVVNQDREKYKYILAVHGTPNAGFIDVDPNNPL